MADRAFERRSAHAYHARAAPSGTVGEARLLGWTWFTLVSAGLRSAPGGIGASGLRLQGCCPQQRNTSRSRKKIGWYGFQLSNRYTNFRPVRTSWHGRPTKALTNVLNSSLSTQRF